MGSTFSNSFKVSKKIIHTVKLKVVISSCLFGPCPLLPSVPFAQESFVFHQMKGTKATIEKNLKKTTRGWAKKGKRASWTGERRPELSTKSCVWVCLWMLLILCEYDTGNERFEGGGVNGQNNWFWGDILRENRASDPKSSERGKGWWIDRKERGMWGDKSLAIGIPEEKVIPSTLCLCPVSKSMQTPTTASAQH